MLVGNCSLSLYPVNEATRDDIADLFAYIEDVPRHLFDDHVPWTWTDYAGYRDAVNARGAGTNLAALVGHSPLRLAVMGDDAWTRVATPDERAAMAASLHEAMDAGAWGLSTSRSTSTRTGGRCRPARPTTPSSTPSSTSSGAAGRGLVEIVPGLLDVADPCRPARGPGPSVRRPRRPAHLDRLHLQRGQPASTRDVARPGPTPPRRGHRAPPAAVTPDRRLPAQLGLVDDVHVDAGGLAPGHRRPGRGEGRPPA